ncbi:AraC family transcriptional regulator [Paenibacillus ginsengarvi]|uniref:Helix-turn-helix domain-containing protein n=1 Tax=Paenibacillus ginsengarvi TaxID=400777 RepID=A0A3B0BJU0_9BACL|nr:AraC family transcriptional regulator [Paenibacillus ginsengarvi]RKN74123.1 helix-turn-helix domain-containing protein [Paenibacillus ginsengarvi]
MFELVFVLAEEVDSSWRKPESVTECDIFLFVESGSLFYGINGQRIALTKGDFLYIPEGSLRYGLGDRVQGHKKYAVGFRTAAPETAAAIPLLGNREHRLIHCRNSDYVKQRFGLLVQMWIGKLPHYQTICWGILLEMLGIAERESENAHVPAKKISLVTDIQTYILSHYREPIRIELLAELVDRTPNYVTKIFREVTGQTPIGYLHQVRVASARDLLLNTHLTIGQVADMMGFCDQSYFNRVYKRIMGHPPSSLQKEKRAYK